MALILLIETATEVCSVGLCEPGRVLALEASLLPYDHAASITLLIDSCLRRADRRLDDIDAVAVSRGPGSYTALRVGVSAAKGVCYALGKPLIAVDTLQALALACRQPGQSGLLYCPMIDARRMEVYSALFDEHNQPLREAGAEVIDISSYSDYFSAGRTVVFCGNAAEKCRPFLTDPKAIFVPAACSAGFLAPLAQHAWQQGQFEDLAYFTPLYLKPPNITIPKKIL